MSVEHDDALERFLVQYCTHAASPHYAVLIEGDWGSGKTWRVKQFARLLTEKYHKQALYVSLYGVTSINDIADQFFRQLNPVLGSTMVQTSWALARSALKGTFKINESVEVELSAPDIKKSLRTHNAVLIFDDLERSSMPVEEVLGIINQLVEHDDHRVLIVANANQVPANAGGQPFATLKEKVIGRTLRLRAEPRAALQAFLRELGDTPGSQQLEKHQDTVLRVFAQAGYHNLRQLRQALLDFSRVRAALQQAQQQQTPQQEAQPAAQQNTRQWQLPDAFYKRLVYEVLALSIEYRAGRLTPAQFDELCATAATLPAPDALLTAAPGGPRLRLHGLDDIAAYALPPALYREFFQSGDLSLPALAQAIEHGKWLVTDGSPAWLQLWHWQRLGNTQFNTLVHELQDAYMAEAFSQPGEFLHATGLLLQFIRMGYLSMPEDTLKTLGNDIIKAKWERSGALYIALAPQERAAVDDEGAYGLHYWSRDDATFRAMQSDLRTAVSNSEQQAFEYWWELWMAELKKDPERWAARIVPHLGVPAQFADVPFTRYVHASEFAKLLIDGDMPMLRTVLRALQLRYAEISNGALTEETEFWNALVSNLDLNAQYRNPDATKTIAYVYLTEQLKPMIADLAARLEAIKRLQRLQEKQ